MIGERAPRQWDNLRLIRGETRSQTPATRRPAEGAVQGGGMDRIWLKHYPPGVPAEIDYSEYRSLGELFESNTEKYRERLAYTNMGRTISFGDLERLSQAFGAWLQGRGSQGARGSR